MPTRTKKFLYRYNGDPRKDESELDLEGHATIPQIGEGLRRNGKNWKVEVVNKDLIMANQKPVPLYRVFLTDKL